MENSKPYLSILCITKGEPHVEPFLRHFVELAKRCEAELTIACDGLDALERVFSLRAFGTSLVGCESRGYVESVLDYALEGTHGRYVLRLDDDERVNEPLAEWLAARWYAQEAHWAFRRLNLWGDAEHALLDPAGLLWPDPQTRLSRRDLAGGRYTIHAASPHGLGSLAPLPCAIEHHKFLVKTLDERRAIAARYDKLEPGKGSGVFLPFSVPEDCWKPEACRRVETGALLRAPAAVC